MARLRSWASYGQGSPSSPAWITADHAMNAVDLSTMRESRKLLIFFLMALGQFMALLDIQIVASSVSEISAGLAAAPDEASWIQTAYLMAEIVMIPLSGVLSRAFSTRWLFSVSAAALRVTSKP